MDFYYFFYKSLSLSLVFFLLLHAGAVTVSKAQSESSQNQVPVHFKWLGKHNPFPKGLSSFMLHAYFGQTGLIKHNRQNTSEVPNNCIKDALISWKKVVTNIPHAPF